MLACYGNQREPAILFMCFVLHRVQGDLQAHQVLLESEDSQ